MNLRNLSLPIVFLGLLGGVAWYLARPAATGTAGPRVSPAVATPASQVGLSADGRTGTLLDLKTDDIARVVIGFADAPDVTAGRAAKDKPWTAGGALPGKHLNSARIKTLLASINPLRCTGTTAPDDEQVRAARAHGRTLTLITFDQTTYTLILGRKPGESGTGPAGPVFAFITCSDASAPVNALMKQRAYLVEAGIFTGLPAHADLWQDIPRTTPKAPDQIPLPAKAPKG